MLLGLERTRLERLNVDRAHQAELVARLKDLGATLADVGQGNVPWIVLADPEGNEFCVLAPARQAELACGGRLRLAQMPESEFA